MDELEIRIVLRYRVPENGLTLNGLLRGLDEDKDLLMRGLSEAILSALEEKAIAEYKAGEPGRYFGNGRQPRALKFITSFGAVRYELAQIYDKNRGRIFCPVMRKLTSWQARRWEGLEAGHRVKAHCLGLCKSWQKIMGSGHPSAIVPSSFLWSMERRWAFKSKVFLWGRQICAGLWLLRVWEDGLSLLGFGLARTGPSFAKTLRRDWTMGNCKCSSVMVVLESRRIFSEKG